MNFSGTSVASTLKEAACQIFLSTLDKIDGAKDLVLSNSILVRLDAICGMQKLRQNAVDKVFKFESNLINSETKNRVYVIRPCVEEVRFVAEQINTFVNQEGLKSCSIDTKYWIIFVPKFVHICDTILEEEGVYEHVSILECPLGLLPLEYDVYSLEDETIFKTLFLNKDITPLNVIVSSLLQLQLLTGNIFDVYGQGKYAKIVADKLDQANLIKGIRPEGLINGMESNHVKDFENLRFTETKLDEQDNRSSFTDLYLIDRDCDYASILLSQVNYEGFIDESYNLCCNKIEFAAPLTSGNQERQLFKHSLSSDHDPIYRDIRDSHFSIVASILHSRNLEVKKKYIRSQEMNLSNLKNFVANELNILKAEFKSLGVHITACDGSIKERNKYGFSDQLGIEQNILDGVEVRKTLDHIAKLISHQLHPQVPLRLLSLLSLTQGGLPPRDYKRFLSLYCENYGLQNNATFANLEKVGLITEMDLSLNAITGGMLGYGSNSSKETTSNNKMSNSIPSSLSLASFTGAMSSLTEKASGRMAAVVSSSVLPRRGNLSAMLKRFQLTPEISDSVYNIREPKDPAFVFNGVYIPLICRIIEQCVLSPNQQQKKNSQLNMTPSEMMKLLPGPNFKRRQAFFNDLPISPTDRSKKSDRSILVFFIGGVTFAEITALRFLAKQKNINIAVATTSLLNGNKLIDLLSPRKTHSSVKTTVK